MIMTLFLEKDAKTEKVTKTEKIFMNQNKNKIQTKPETDQKKKNQ